MRFIILSIICFSSNCYAVEKLKAEGQVRVTIISQEQAEVSCDSGTVVYAADGSILQVIF